jgi:hypothetical protein
MLFDRVCSVFIVLVNNQLDAQFFFVYVYFNSLHVSSTHVLIIHVGDRLVSRLGASLHTRRSPT